MCMAWKYCTLFLKITYLTSVTVIRIRTTKIMQFEYVFVSSYQHA